MNRLTLQPHLARHTISRHVYGHFAEHLGRCIYDGLWVGEDSSIPHDRGLRLDVIEALKGIGIPNLRWPGGCFADTYHWRDGIGPRAQRPSIVNTHWGGVTENNHFGTHEFLTLCELLSCEPYLCGNVGSGTVAEMSDWVEYVNMGGESPMAKLRRANGRHEPWGVRLWGVGNENWGCGGNMRPEYYADLYRQFQSYCRDYGPAKLFKIAGGSVWSDFNWTRVLMREAGKHMHGLSYHAYVIPGPWEKKGSATAFDEEHYLHAMKLTSDVAGLLDQHIAIMDEYDPQERVAMVCDEWGIWLDVEPGTNPGFLYQQNSMRDALVAGVWLNHFNQRARRIRIANLAQTVNVLQSVVLTQGPELLRTPTWHVFEMYRVHHEATLVPIVGDLPTLTHGNATFPAVSASASCNPANELHVTLCNLDPRRAQRVRLHIHGVTVQPSAGRVLTADRVQACNTFEQPDAVRSVPFTAVSVVGDAAEVELPPASVVVLRLA